MAPPKTLCEGRYKVKDVLGQSERSIVYTCFDTVTEERVAVKVLNVSGPNPEIAREMYKREVGALSGFEHPHVVQLLRYEAEEELGRLNIVLELVGTGQTLEDLIAKTPLGGSPPPLRWRLEQAAGLLDVLAKAHARPSRIIHRDVKLKNILMDRENNVLKLGDFGIARILETYGRGSPGQTLRHFFTRPFAAPEQALGQETSFPADIHAFAVVLASLLAWRAPPLDFTAAGLTLFLADYTREHGHAALTDKLPAVIRRSLAEKPQERPRIPDLELAIAEARDALVERVAVPVILTNTPQRKALDLGLKISILDDLNQGPLRIFYEPGDEGRWSIWCLGRHGQARLAPDPAQEDKLKLVEYIQMHGSTFARRREQATPAPFMLVQGEGSAQPLLDFAWEDHQRRQAERDENADRDAMLNIASFILKKQRERLESIRVRYRLADEEAPKQPAIPDTDLKRKLAGITPSAPVAPTVRPPDLSTMRTFSSEFVRLKVLSVQAGFIGDTTEPPEDDVIPADFGQMLGDDSTFGFAGKDIGQAYDYDAERKILTLKLRKQVSLPIEGEVTCDDVATKTSLERQEKALTTFRFDEAVNPRLGKLLLHPEENRVEERLPIDLIQAGLQPAEAIADMVGRAMAARDLFLVQGPPGTGKTTFITELMSQILVRNPTARILLSSQANEAVNNAVDALREQDRTLRADWRIVRDQRSAPGRGGALAGFDYDFAEWAKKTRARSAEASKSIPAHLTVDKQRAVADALQNWRDKLPAIPDVKQDYAESVQVWAMTLLRVPTLWQRMRAVRFDYVIVDEAARATTSELLVALVTGARFVLVGDHKQLPPFFDQETKDDLRVAEFDVDRACKSLFEVLFDDINPENKTTLRRNFRMHRSIGTMIGDLYYPTVGLENGVPDEKRTFPVERFGGDHRVFWYDVKHGRQRQDQNSDSLWNLEEIDTIEHLVGELATPCRGHDPPLSIGVIAAYGDQTKRLFDRLQPNSRRWQGLRLRVATVDAFQGKQDDVLIYSMVRTNSAELRFISDPRRLNVAFSRAKRLLVIVGHRETGLLSPEIAKVVRHIHDTNVVSIGRAR